MRVARGMGPSRLEALHWGIYALAWALLLWDLISPGPAALRASALSDPIRLGFAAVLALAALIRAALGIREIVAVVGLVVLAVTAYQAVAPPERPETISVWLEDGSARILPEGVSRVPGGRLVIRYPAAPGALLRWGFSAGDSPSCPLDRRYANVRSHADNLTLGEVGLGSADSVGFCASVLDRKERVLIRAAGVADRLPGGEYEVSLEYEVRDLGRERELLLFTVGVLVGYLLDWLRQQRSKGG